ncbi:MAG TPA: penicillin-binding protein 1C [Dokdonella sp.]|uniref:penicillin-binding protein 1C n=1 Tax=Dokdonella sp. TaxID=2291710 RepID=UPI002D804828|nr:penicillin-binding protein 1C [Dokdonella sp.]HET9033481.1 penicillin-binding protein 1C [Dokdonella sp.]
MRLSRWFRWLRRLTFVFIGVAIVSLILDRIFPLPLPDPNRGSTVVLARDGSPLRAFADAEGIWSYPVSIDDVSPLYLEALVGYEDRWFWHHPGVNPVAALRAFGQMIFNGHIVSGGSTLTMQVARILEPHSRSFSGKLRQSLRALQLEAHLSKREILELYLDNAPFGGTLQGVEAASWAYLGHSADRLSHAEAALLAVLPQAPSRLRPDRHPALARAARDKVLDRMATLDVWTADEVKDARIESVVARTLQPPLSAALLARRLHNEHPRQRRIATTIDIELQRSVQDRVSNYLARLPERTSAALLVVDNSDLSTLAYVGSAAFGDEARLGHVDMVQAWRSPGSTLKPFLYGLALDDGLIHSESLLIDAPQSFGDYRPGNFDSAFNGPVGAAEALRLSLNVPAVDLLDRVGAARFTARLANTGLRLRLPHGVEPNLSIILGGVGARMEDLAGAYAALNRKGIGGIVRYMPDDALVERRVLSEGAAWIVREILEANPRPGYRPGTFDTGSRPRVAWKTGTSYGYRDAWAIGGTHQYTVAVWIGRPDGTPLPGQYGAVTALPLMFQVVDSLPGRTLSSVPKAPPASVSEREICWPLGLAYDEQHPDRCQQKMDAWVLDGVVPPTFPERDARSWSAGLLHVRIDARSGQRLSPGCPAALTREIDIPRWPSLAYPWLSRSQRRQSSLPRLAPQCADDGLESSQELRIDGIADHASVARAPNSDKPAIVRLRALGAIGEVMWLVNGRLEATTRDAQSWEHAFAETGDQTITAMTDAGRWAQVRVRVLR